jgi:CHAT domain-containing protein
MARYTEAWKLAGQGKWDDAISGMKAVIAEDPTFWRAYRGLAEIGQQGRELEIESYFKQLARIDPASPWPHFGLGFLLFPHESRAAEGARHYRDCLQRSPDAYVCGLRWAVAEQPNRATLADLQLVSQPGRSVAQGRLLESQGRHEEAIGVLEPGVEQAEASNQWDLAMYLHEALSDTYRDLGGLQRPEIVPRLQRALELARQTQDIEEQLSLMLGIGGRLWDQGRKEESKEWSQRSLEEATAIGHLGLQSDVFKGIGNRYMDEGEPEKALEAFTQAESLAQRLTASPNDWALRHMAAAYQRLGRYPEAMQIIEERLQYDERGGHGFGVALDLRQIGNLSHETGDYFRALRASVQSVNVFEHQHAEPQAGAGLGNIGLVYAELGDYEDAASYTRRSLESARKFGDLSEQQRNLENLSDVYLRMGQPSRAIESLNEAAQLFTAVNNKEFNIGTLLGLAEARSRLGQHDRALAAAREAEALARSLKSKPVEADVLEQLGEREMEAGELAAAERDLRASLLQAQEMPLPSVTAAAEIALAALARRRNDLTGALRELEPAVRAIESLRASIAEPDLKARFLETKARAYDEIVEVLSLLHDRHPNAGYHKLAFDYAERGRARAFLDMLAESRSRITKGMTGPQVARHASLMKQLSDASTAVLTEYSDAKRRAVENAETNLADFVQELGKVNPAFRDLQSEPYTTAEAQALAKQAGCTILAYHLGRRRSQLWVVDAHGVRMLPLPARGRISAEVMALRQQLTHRPTDEAALRAYSDRAVTLYGWLFAPASSLVKPGGKILVVPDGILHYLPFEVLERPETKRFLLEDFTIAYAPSVSTCGHLRNHRRSGAGQRSLLAFADPVFPKEAAQPAERDLVRGIYERGGVQFVRLPNTRKEVESIANLYKSADRKVYLGGDATKAALQREHLAGYRVLHLATHAVIDERVPARSGVVLSGSGAEDGILRVPDVFNLDLDADLVVLSACQTGLGKLVKGEGMVGLTRSFLYAGSSRIAVSLWEVSDMATAELMESFYRGMRGGAAPAAALRDAKLNMLKSARPAYRHPYFWAPFVITGLF